jgi:benzoyl-CoA 2,3-dioxygenase component B
MAIDYQERIPNNVDLASDRVLQRALEHWQPRFLDWWRDLGPTDFQAADVYLRTAVSVDRQGWATFGHVKMPEYRWGIFLAERDPDRRIGFGDEYGKPVWQQVPGELRSSFRRLIVTQGDTEPASVEQQRLLGHTAPSLYDLRGLFQVNVEEGRHLWAMVYLLHAYFGRDGREEAEELLCRHSGDVDKPRILGTFNEPISDWLSFFMFTFFTDRDGKYQLMSLAESGFDPLARTCQFMLTEEAHHMFIGHTGLARVTRRTLEVMAELGAEDPEAVRRAGAIDLPTIQRYINFWFSSSLDLFGSEASSNAALYFAAGIKGRPNESRFEDHLALSGTWRLEAPDGAGGVRGEDVPMRNAMNVAIRTAYSDECQLFLDRWNDQIKRAGFDFRYRLPSERFRRAIGVWAGAPTDPEGRPITRDAFERGKQEWLPTERDRAFIHSLMQPVTEPGKMAAWIAPPERGINNQPVDYEYVRQA